VGSSPFPIIASIDVEKKIKMILDGNHRLLKAKNNREKLIKVRLLHLDKCPADFIEMFT